MSVAGFLDLEFFVRPSGSWISLGVRRVLPTADAAGTETFDLTFDMPFSGAIANPAGDDFRVVVVGMGATSSTDKITAFPSVKWQVDGTTPTETAIAERVKVTVTPQNV